MHFATAECPGKRNDIFPESWVRITCDKKLKIKSLSIDMTFFKDKNKNSVNLLNWVLLWMSSSKWIRINQSSYWLNIWLTHPSLRSVSVLEICVYLRFMEKKKKSKVLVSFTVCISIMSVFRPAIVVASSVVTSAMAHYRCQQTVLSSGETVSEDFLSLRKASEHNSIRGALAVQWQ